MTIFISFFAAARSTRLWAMVLLMTLAVPATVQNDVSRKVDKIISKAMTDEGIPGVAVGVLTFPSRQRGEMRGKGESNEDFIFRYLLVAEQARTF